MWGRGKWYFGTLRNNRSNQNKNVSASSWLPAITENLPPSSISIHPVQYFVCVLVCVFQYFVLHFHELCYHYTRFKSNHFEPSAVSTSLASHRPARDSEQVLLLTARRRHWRALRPFRQWCRTGSLVGRGFRQYNGLKMTPYTWTEKFESFEFFCSCIRGRWRPASVPWGASSVIPEWRRERTRRHGRMKWGEVEADPFLLALNPGVPGKKKKYESFRR